jgi:hypothetical protein
MLTDRPKTGHRRIALHQARPTIAITGSSSFNMHMRTISSPTHRTRRSFFALALCLAVSFTAYTSAHAKFLRTQPDVPQSSGKPNNPAINGLVTLVQTPSDQTLWRVDLHSVGYPTGNSQLQWQRGLGSFDTVDFVSNGVVVATFITQEPAAALQ